MSEKHRFSALSGITRSLLLVLLLLLVVCFISACAKKKISSWEKGVWISIEGAYDADFSPDGKHLIFTDSQRAMSWKEDLWLYSMDSGEKEPLLRNVFWDGEARWSPDGSMIVFTIDTMGLKNIVLYYNTSRESVDLTKGGGYHPCWSPDGESIVFVSERSGSTELWVVDIKSQIMKQITSLDTEVATPAWAPDNSGIVFCSKAAGQWDLWFLPLDGVKPYSLFTTDQNECYPRWSRSGNYLAFSSFLLYSDGKVKSSSIWITAGDKDTFPGPVRNILRTKNPEEKLFYPAFSPDESLLVFSTDQTKYRWDIGFIDLSKKLD